MGGMKVSNIDFIRLLPAFMQDDEAAIALSKAVSKLISEPSIRIPSIRTWNEVDNLSEAECDELAWELDVDWYDYAYTLDTKRNLLKGSVGIHKKMGTKYAVEKALSAVYGTAAVEEWFDYGGNPYHFRVTVDIGNTGLSAETTRQIEEKMWFYKNLRSHCDGIFYTISTKRAEVKVAGIHKLGARLKVRPLLSGGIEALAAQGITGTYLRSKQTMTIRKEQ